MSLIISVIMIVSFSGRTQTRQDH